MSLDGGLLAACAANWPQKENLATAALHYIVRRSPSARDALSKLLNEAFQLVDDSLTDPLGFAAQQTASDNSRPDLTVFDGKGKRRGLLEIKLFASLTERQPLLYLTNLPLDGRGILLFVAPASYLPSLWEAVCDACNNDEEGCLNPLSPDIDSSYFQVVEFDNRHLLAAISWKALLAYLVQHMQTPAYNVPSDLLQLRTFIERMDPTMNFQAWSSQTEEDLSPTRGIQLVRYRMLLDTIVTKASQTCQDGNVGKAKPMRGGAGWFGRYVMLGGVSCLVHFSALRWSRCQGCPPKDATPLWCGIYSKDSKFLRQVGQELRAKLKENDEWRFQDDDDDGGIVVALRIPVGDDEPRVLKALIANLCEIAEVLKGIAPPVP